MSSENICQFHILCEKVFAGVKRSFSHSESNQFFFTLGTLGPAILRAMQEVVYLPLTVSDPVFPGKLSPACGVILSSMAGPREARSKSTSSPPSGYSLRRGKPTQSSGRMNLLPGASSLPVNTMP